MSSDIAGTLSMVSITIIVVRPSIPNFLVKSSFLVNFDPEFSCRVLGSVSEGSSLYLEVSLENRHLDRAPAHLKMRLSLEPACLTNPAAGYAMGASLFVDLR